ncbi:hypothetical protein niasHT_035859 [Heterodera trifolii]|uniref:Uncharacterized protein n=1 Tax=Heterodera trifolii TaxID=157864 RepID=A0ABD2IIE6_9BILA
MAAHCPPVAEATQDSIGYLLSAIFQWFATTTLLPNDTMGQSLEQLKSDFSSPANDSIKHWPLITMKSSLNCCPNSLSQVPRLRMPFGTRQVFHNSSREISTCRRLQRFFVRIARAVFHRSSSPLPSIAPKIRKRCAVNYFWIGSDVFVDYVNDGTRNDDIKRELLKLDRKIIAAASIGILGQQQKALQQQQQQQLTSNDITAGGGLPFCAIEFSTIFPE